MPHARARSPQHQSLAHERTKDGLHSFVAFEKLALQFFELLLGHGGGRHIVQNRADEFEGTRLIRHSGEHRGVEARPGPCAVSSCKSSISSR